MTENPKARGEYRKNDRRPRLAAILVADVGVREHREWHVRRPRQRRLPSKAVISDAGVVAEEVNRKEARLLERGHHRCGRPRVFAGRLRPDPKRTLVASDRMARIDVKLPVAQSHLVPLIHRHRNRRQG